MTRQEIVNRNYQWFFVQGHGPAFEIDYNRSWVNCRLQAGAERCAIGCCIPNELYREALEELPVESLILASRELSDLFHPEDCQFLVDLQRCHDDPITPSMSPGDKPAVWHDRFEERLRDLCQAYSLTWPGDQEETP